MFSTDPLELLGSLGPISIIVLLILLGFSVFSWGIILYKWRLLRLIKKEERQFLQTYQEEASLSEEALQQLQSVTTQWPNSPSGSVFLEVLSRMGHVNVSDVTMTTQKAYHWPDRQYLEKVIQYLVQKQIARQEAYLPFLATTGNITPFIGLLGTVVGVIHAFQQIGIEGTASIASVAPGLSEALLATAAGLFAAIPAVIGYNYYLSQIRKTVFGVEAFSIEFLNTLDARAPESKKPSSRSTTKPVGLPPTLGPESKKPRGQDRL